MAGGEKDCDDDSPNSPVGVDTVGHELLGRG
jgi:hypothetical protein